MGKLYDAAQRGDVTAVATLLGRGADPNETGDDDGTTALIAAAFLGHVDVVRLLVERGAEIDRPNAHGSRALGAAARNAKGRVIAHLLKAGASLTAEAESGATAFMDAAIGPPHVVRVFLEHGVDVNAVSSKGYTALHCAARNDLYGPEVIRLLLDAGADPSRRDARGRTPRDLAAELGRTRNVEVLDAAGVPGDRSPCR